MTNFTYRIRKVAISFFCFLSLLIVISNKAKATLAAGDLAVIGFNCDPNASTSKTFAIVALAKVNPGEVIYFSDKAYYSNAFSALLGNGSEGIFSLTTSSSINAGTIIMFTLTSGVAPSVTTTPNVGTSVIIEGWTNTSGNVSPFGANGDAILIYQGSEASPSFIFGFNDGNNTTTVVNGWNTGLATNPNGASELPASLTSGTTAIGFGGLAHIDNLRYNSTLTGTKAALLTAICATTNWVSDDNTEYNLTPGTGVFTGTNPIFSVTTTPTTWNGSTWSNGNPDAVTDAIIASSIAPSSFSCKALNINNTFTLNTTGISATVNGNITNSGNGVSGTGILDIAAASTLSGNPITLSGTLNITAGTLTTGGLLSLASGGKITGAYANISGNVTLQQSIIGQRGWRIFANPFSTLQTVSTLASTNGINITTIPQASGLTDARTFSNATNTWSNITGATINANTAYSLFIRGLSSEVTGTNYTAGPSAFTYKATGTLNGNSVSITPTSTSNFILVGNPYAAPIKTSALTNGAGISYYVYTIAQGGTQNLQRTKVGSWAPVLSSSAASTIPVLGAIAYKPVSISTYNITASTDINTSGSLQTGLFREQNTIPHLELQVEQDGMYQDKLFIRLDAHATGNGIDNTDLEKFWNDNVNLYTKTVDSKYLGVDARSTMDSISVGISALAGDYIIKVANNSLPAGYTTYLTDNLLNTRTELKENTSYPFSITNDLASKGEQRFVLNFFKALPLVLPQAFEVKVLGNSINSNTVSVSIAGTVEPVSIVVTDMLGRKVSTITNLTNGTKSISLGSIQSGMYFLQISNGKTVSVEKIVKQ